MNLGAKMVSNGCGPGLGHQPKWTCRFGDSDFMRWYFTAQVLQLKSPLLFSTPGLAVMQGSKLGCVFIPSPVRDHIFFSSFFLFFQTKLKPARKVSADANLKRF